jgi:hypothetical protein
MDTEQVVEVMGDQGWDEGETILGNSTSHADIEKEEGNDRRGTTAPLTLMMWSGRSR